MGRIGFIVGVLFWFGSCWLQWWCLWATRDMDVSCWCVFAFACLCGKGDGGEMHCSEGEGLLKGLAEHPSLPYDLELGAWSLGPGAPGRERVRCYSRRRHKVRLAGSRPLVA